MSKLDKFQLLKQLADGAYHSGQALAQQFQVTRSAIWGLVKSLEKEGVPLNVVRGKGYQIPAGLELLDADIIRGRLSPVVAKRVSLNVYPEVDSTNNLLLSTKPKVSGTICLAETQTKGRGRFGREWRSPLAANIYCSQLWEYDKPAATAAGLSLAVGIAITRVLRDYHDNIQLKWPNDIVVGRKKLGGILIDISGDANGPCYFVIGFGLNVRLPQAIDDATDLFGLTGQMLSRNQLAAELITSTQLALTEFKQGGFDTFHHQWREYDVMAGKSISLQVGEERHEGIAQGIDNQGCLILESRGQTQNFYSGVTTILSRDV